METHHDLHIDYKRFLRIIETARNKDSINEAAKNGFRLIIKKVEASSLIRSKYSVVQHKKTREIEVIKEFQDRLDFDANPDYKTIIDWTFYYPYNFESPYAAYLIPPDVKKGQRVMVEDVIEDIVEYISAEGIGHRLQKCEAIWNGKDLILQLEKDDYRDVVIVG
jgi:hypothetical protein